MSGSRTSRDHIPQFSLKKPRFTHGSRTRRRINTRIQIFLNKNYLSPSARLTTANERRNSFQNIRLDCKRAIDGLSAAESPQDGQGCLQATISSPRSLPGHVAVCQTTTSSPQNPNRSRSLPGHDLKPPEPKQKSQLARPRPQPLEPK